MDLKGFHGVLGNFKEFYRISKDYKEFQIKSSHLKGFFSRILRMF